MKLIIKQLLGTQKWVACPDWLGGVWIGLWHTPEEEKSASGV